MRHIISLLMVNETGALSRVAGLFSARGYNIELLTVAPTEDMTLSRMTIVTSGSDAVIEQINKQLNKLIDVTVAASRFSSASKMDLFQTLIASGNRDLRRSDRATRRSAPMRAIHRSCPRNLSH